MLVRLRATKTMARSCARRRAYLTFAALAVLVAYQHAEGQESSQLPTLERQQPGVAEGIPNDVLPPGGAPSIDELSAPLIGQALVSLFPFRALVGHKIFHYFGMSLLQWC